MPSRAAMMRWIAPVGGAVAALAVAVLFVALPATVLEDWVWRSGLPSLIGAAEPPLGTTARAVLALAGGALAGAVIWSALFLLFGPGGLLAPRVASSDGVPVLRRADAHPDAPARRPLSAADLEDDDDMVFARPVTNSPPPPPPVEQPIPADLDLPLAAFHPGALPPVPLTPVRPVPPLRVPAKPAAEEPAAPVAPPTIESLIDRLERVTRRRPKR
ncbi:hypothetical protein [uncultured Sphingomonas sp.]|uniref:hypothetical protein n=1 Tax=uncultured Sphingomonas sp. TaxID=158754 RepID=UPI0025CB7DA3|nr:hypothetical protein [uncultured Sphingomonas sp.]